MNCHNNHEVNNRLSFSPFSNMDSEQDAIEQLTNLDESVCYNSFCLGDVYHEWGACSNFLSNVEVQPLTLPIPAAVAFDPLEEELLDGCGLGVCQPLDHQTEEPQPPATEKGVANQLFAPPKSEEELQRARLESIPKKTRQDTQYCVRLWNSWAQYRKQNTGVTGRLGQRECTALALSLCDRNSKKEWSRISTKYTTPCRCWNNATLASQLQQTQNRFLQRSIIQ